MSHLINCPDGFLHPEREAHALKDVPGSGASFERALEANRRCHAFFKGLFPGRLSGRHIIALSVFVRLHELYQGVLKCALVGSRAASEVLLRAELEALFTLRAVSRDSEALRLFAEQHHHHKKKLLASVRDGWATISGQPDPDRARQALERLEGHIKAEGITPLTTLELAKRAEMEDWYQTVYRRLENPAHCKALDLERYFLLDDAGEIRGFGALDDFERVDVIVPTGEELLLLGWQELLSVLGRSPDPWIDAEMTAIMEIANAWREPPRQTPNTAMQPTGEAPAAER